jgi:hypothetical protein
MDTISLAGQLETTTLNVYSNYYHYLVYLLVAVTLIAFIFYLLLNPEANVVNIMYVVSGLVLVFIML